MTSEVTNEFVFSQSNLQTYLACRYKFYLRYVKHLRWPAQTIIDALRYEQDRDAGSRFHQLLHQFNLGFDLELLKNIAKNDPDMRVLEWFGIFLNSPFASLDGELYPEKVMKCHIGDSAFVAKYDLLQFDAGVYTIYDWKTSRRAPSRKVLEDKVQTRLYPLVLAENHAFDKSISLIIWELNQAEKPFEFVFYKSEIEKNRQYFLSLTLEIKTLKPTDFTLTNNLHTCSYCEYRSLCRRGRQAISLEELDQLGIEGLFVDDETGILDSDLV